MASRDYVREVEILWRVGCLDAVEEHLATFNRLNKLTGVPIRAALRSDGRFPDGRVRIEPVDAAPDFDEDDIDDKEMRKGMLW